MRVMVHSAFATVFADDEFAFGYTVINTRSTLTGLRHRVENVVVDFARPSAAVKGPQTNQTGSTQDGLHRRFWRGR
jgi:hypothetical protein